MRTTTWASCSGNRARLSEAQASYVQALKVDPDYADAHYNLGVVLQDLGRMSEAGASYVRALKLNPQLAKAQNNLGIVLQDLGRTSEAEASYRRALEIDPGYADAHSNLLFALNYHPDKRCRQDFFRLPGV